MVDGDPTWDAFVATMLSIGPLDERRSRYGDKPALFAERREIAHLEAPGVVDLRVTRAGWSRAEPAYGANPAVRRDSSRRDWVELRLTSPADVERLRGLLAIAVEANG